MTHCSSTVRRHRSTRMVFSHRYPDSGHGGQTEDLDGDEDDGYDEGMRNGPFYKYSSSANSIWCSHLPREYNSARI
jgi:hypothetical protein